MNQEEFLAKVRATVSKNQLRVTSPGLRAWADVADPRLTRGTVGTVTAANATEMIGRDPDNIKVIARYTRDPEVLDLLLSDLWSAKVETALLRRDRISKDLFTRILAHRRGKTIPKSHLRKYVVLAADHGLQLPEVSVAQLRSLLGTGLERAADKAVPTSTWAKLLTQAMASPKMLRDLERVKYRVNTLLAPLRAADEMPNTDEVTMTIGPAVSSGGVLWVPSKASPRARLTVLQRLKASVSTQVHNLRSAGLLTQRPDGALEASAEVAALIAELVPHVAWRWLLDLDVADGAVVDYRAVSELADVFRLSFDQALTLRRSPLTDRGVRIDTLSAIHPTGLRGSVRQEYLVASLSTPDDFRLLARVKVDGYEQWLRKMLAERSDRVLNTGSSHYEALLGLCNDDALKVMGNQLPPLGMLKFPTSVLRAACRHRSASLEAWLAVYDGLAASQTDYEQPPVTSQEQLVSAISAVADHINASGG